MKRMKKSVRKVILSAVFALFPAMIPMKIVAGENLEPIHFVPELTLENVYREIVKQEIRYPEIVFKQVIAETMWLKCSYCSKEMNNLFGFRTNKGYLQFDDWTESVAYYKQWQDSYFKEEKYKGDYFKFLTGIGYATAPNYIRLLKSIDVEEII